MSLQDSSSCALIPRKFVEFHHMNKKVAMAHESGYSGFLVLFEDGHFSTHPLNKDQSQIARSALSNKRTLNEQDLNEAQPKKVKLEHNEIKKSSMASHEDDATCTSGWPKKQNLKMNIATDYEKDGCYANAVNIQIVYSTQELYDIYNETDSGLYDVLLKLISELDADFDFNLSDTSIPVEIDHNAVTEAHIFIDKKMCYWYKDWLSPALRYNIKLLPLSYDDDVEFVSESSTPVVKCCECNCDEYPSCTAYGEACENCIDGSGGHHLRLRKDGTGVKDC